jgi:hypothetical protein
MARTMLIVRGVFGCLIVAILTGGAIRLPLEGVLLLPPFAVINYLLWCRRGDVP